MLNWYDPPPPPRPHAIKHTLIIIIQILAASWTMRDTHVDMLRGTCNMSLAKGKETSSRFHVDSLGPH